MTPLAHAIAKDATEPVKRRWLKPGTAQDLGIFDDLHFFECTSVSDLALSLGQQMLRHPSPRTERLAFLPAPRTWLESAFHSATTKRAAYLLEEDAEGCAWVRHVYMCHEGGKQVLDVTQRNMRLPLFGGEHRIGTYEILPDQWHGPRTEQVESTDLQAAVIYGLLACINTPRVIGRRQHLPHAGLQRRIASSRGLVGRWPLHAWHELVLEVSPPRDESGLGPREVHLTGEKALHFVRCHLRIRLGMLELVSAHWRGDPALGIKQTRYRVVPGRRAA